MRKLVAGLGLSLTLLSSTALAQNQFTSITVFGDSVSDNGNIPKLFGAINPLATNFPVSPPYYNNHFTNGPVYAEYLPGLLNVPAGQFTDYAIGGAFTGVGNIIPSLIVPTGQGGMSNEIDSFTAAGRSFGRRDLVVVFGGPNDYFNFLGGPVATPGLSAAQVTALINTQVQTTVNNLVNDVTRAANLGARYFVVPNLQSLGNTPSYRNGAEQGIATQTTQTHNAALAQAMNNLANQLHVTIVMPDTYTADADIVANPAKYGFTNVTTQCKSGPTGFSGTVCATPSTYRYWDAVHPTAAAHQLVAQLIAATINGPTTIGAEGDMAILAVDGLYDQLASRTRALRGGASGLSMTTGSGDTTQLGSDPDKRWSGYVSGTYGWGSRDDRFGATGFSYDQTNITGGLDYRLLPTLVVGGLFGFGDISGDLHGGLGKASEKAYEGALYATWFTDDYYVGGAFTYIGNDWDKLTRNTFVAGQSAQASTKGRTAGWRIEAGYTLHAGNFTIGPVAELRQANIHIDGYTEYGAVALNQQVDFQGLNSLIGEFGVQAGMQTEVSGVSVAPRLRLAYDNQFDHGARTVTSRLVSNPALTSSTYIDAPKGHWLRLGGGADIAIDKTLTAMIDFDTTIARSDAEDHRATAKLKFAF